MSDVNQPQNIQSVVQGLEFEGEPPTVPSAEERKVPSNALTGLWKAIRPHQWIKNLLVIVAPLAAVGSNTSMNLTDISAWFPILYAFASFCLAASSIYLINDVRDVESDKQHPTKRYRPIAAGVVSPALATIAAIACALLAVFVAAQVNYQLTIVIIVYIAIQLGYCFGLKNQAVIDIAIVSSGFLMRAIAGGVSVGIHLSRWFLLVMAFGSLFMAAGKRYAELHLAEQTGAKIRKSLRYYTTSYLRFVWTLAATAVVVSYGMWALDTPKNENIFYAMSVAPFTIAILRYAIDIDGAVAGAPEEIAMHDRVLQILALVWIGTVGAAVFFS